MSEHNEYYRRFYDGVAGYWDALYRRDEQALSIYALHYRQRHQEVLDMVRRSGIAPGMTVLDAGCGPGAYLSPLLAMDLKVCAVDQSPKMVESARANVEPQFTGRAEVRVAEVDALPFADASFDLVLNIAVLMYVPKPAAVLAELRRVLKPGGTLVITVDNRRDLADLIDLPMRARRLWRRLRKAPPPQYPSQHAEGVRPRRYSPAEMRRLLQAAGLTPVEETSLGFAPLLLNGRRVLSDRADVRLDRLLTPLRYLPGLRLTGYTYICRCRREEG
ncbi:MAG TPA: methyltransferase domain-containing protein [Candidatus Competibacteraceae bacterium]|nr:methyltransferase domain-containing protein [Candidatus Competibacteraceae bacterium]